MNTETRIPALNYDPTDPDKMRLPAGLTCGNCHHIHRCKAIFGHVELTPPATGHRHVLSQARLKEQHYEQGIPDL